MTPTNSSMEGILADLERQGLSIKVHNRQNNTWFIKGEGIFQGYIASSDELIELKRANQLNLRGIKSLG